MSRKMLPFVSSIKNIIFKKITYGLSKNLPCSAYRSNWTTTRRLCRSSRTENKNKQSCNGKKLKTRAKTTTTATRPKTTILRNLKIIL